jgi:hypothetical protein
MLADREREGKVLKNMVEYKKEDLGDLEVEELAS